MSHFPTAAHLASWAGMCPGHNESAGKQHDGKTRKGSPWLRQALIEAAATAGKTKGTYLAAAAIHLDTAIPNFVVQEYARTDETSKWSGFQGVLQRHGGYLLPPELPGLGIRLVDTNVAESLAPLGNRPLHQIPARSDGSVVYAV